MEGGGWISEAQTEKKSKKEEEKKSEGTCDTGNCSGVLLIEPKRAASRFSDPVSCEVSEVL